MDNTVSFYEKLQPICTLILCFKPHSEKLFQPSNSFKNDLCGAHSGVGLIPVWGLDSSASHGFLSDDFWKKSTAYLRVFTVYFFHISVFLVVYIYML